MLGNIPLLKKRYQKSHNVKIGYSGHGLGIYPSLIAIALGAEMIEKHYLLDPDWKRAVGQKAIDSYEKKGIEPPSKDPLEVGDRVVVGLKKYVTSGPVVAMVWQGAHVVEVIRKITGSTEPRSSDVGAIRVDYR